jgi:hypothetical protein
MTVLRRPPETLKQHWRTGPLRELMMLSAMPPRRWPGTPLGQTMPTGRHRLIGKRPILRLPDYFDWPLARPLGCWPAPLNWSVHWQLVPPPFFPRPIDCGPR